MRSIEVRSLMDGYRRIEKSHLELMEDFRAFDRNDDGRIDYIEFKEFLESLDARFDADEARVGFVGIDVDRDGLINSHEFLSWWRSQ